MERTRQTRRARVRAPLVAALVLGAAGSVAMMGEHGLFVHVARQAAAIPGVTVEDDAANAAMPVVTSLRSNGEAERLGLRVGDRISEVDGRPVRDAEDVRRTIEHETGNAVSLHVRRGDTVWTVAIDRAETSAKPTEQHEPQDTVG